MDVSSTVFFLHSLISECKKNMIIVFKMKIPFLILTFLRFLLSCEQVCNKISSQRVLLLWILKGFSNVYNRAGKCENYRKERSRARCVSFELTKLMSEEE